jgi:NAD(P)-dependent dehydrogenase (short-subunit alcohol dehydrogenase family)
VEINLGGVIHLTRLFLPHLRSVPRAAVVNVTSGLSFVPKARARGRARWGGGSLGSAGCLGGFASVQIPANRRG